MLSAEFVEATEDAILEALLSWADDAEAPFSTGVCCAGYMIYTYVYICIYTTPPTHTRTRTRTRAHTHKRLLGLRSMAVADGTERAAELMALVRLPFVLCQSEAMERARARGVVKDEQLKVPPWGLTDERLLC